MTVVGMVEPPGLPTASITRLGSSLENTSVGDMEDSGTLPGAMALASPVTSP